MARQVHVMIPVTNSIDMKLTSSFISPATECFNHEVDVNMFCVHELQGHLV